MDLIVRTAHGTADVSIDVSPDGGATLRDLVVAVSGQAAPPAALVDGRTTDISTPLDRCVIHQGTVVDTDLSRAPGANAAGATLFQLTGPGAGEIRALQPGVHRVGPGRRAHARELDAAPVETPVFEIDVRSAAVTVVSSPTPAEVLVDGRPLDAAVEWAGGTLSAHGRVFALEGPMPPPPPTGDVGTDGRMLFNRPPTGGVDGERLLVVDAVRDARWRRPALWSHRLDHNASCPVDVGIVPHTGRTATIDLDGDRTLAVVGDAVTTAAHARAILVDAVTRYGPSDLAVVVATTDERLGDWDWAKWLPHVGTGDRPDLLCSEPDLADLTARVPLGRSRRTLVIVTDDRLWNGPDSPLRRLVLSDSPHTSLIVLTGSEHSAPASCQSFVDHLDGTGRARLVRLTRGRAQLELWTPLVEVETAAEVARSLAALRDPDLDVGPAARPPGPATLAEFVGAGDDRHPRDGAAAARWDRNSERATPIPLPVGTSDGAPVHVQLDGGRGVVVSGSSLDEADDIVRALVLSMATTWSPNELSLVIVDHRPTDGADPIRRLPHHAGTFSVRGAAAARAMVARLGGHLRSSPGSRLAVVVHGAAETRLAAPGALAGLIAVAEELPGCHLIVSTDLPLAALDATVRSERSYEITVDHHGGRRRGSLHDPRTGRRQSFVPFETPAEPGVGVVARPFVFGRSPTSLERRLARRGPDGNAHHGGSRAIERVVDGLRELAAERGITNERSLVPVELPDSIDATDLLRRHPGDGVPIGLVERPDTGTLEPYWWAPDSGGSVLAIGSPRSGTRVVTDLLVLGCAERFGPDDVHVHLLDAGQARRDQFLRLPHVRAACSPDREDDVDALLAPLLRRLDDGAVDRTDDPDRSATVLLVVREIERLTPAAKAAVARLASDGAAVRVHVVATATRRHDVDEVLDRFARILAGDPAEDGDLDGLGVDDVEDVLRRPGRCVALPERRLVQLAALSLTARPETGASS